MRIAVLGGSLQGVEATYLAHKAGWEVLLLDKNPNAPATGLCDRFIQCDLTQTDQLEKGFKDIDIIIPATENARALQRIVEWNRQAGFPLTFDADAYAISSSKQDSDRLFAQLGLAVPQPWPHCGFPLIAKPNSASGSEGVQLILDRAQLEKTFSILPPPDWVLQEYMEGPSFSLEILGTPGNYTTFQVTDLDMDAAYDCKRVLAPGILEPRQVKEFENIARQIAEAIRLKGLMDVEVILHHDHLKLLEIDARLPSQTPTTVYWSTGINMLEGLAQCFLGGTAFNGLKFSHGGHRGHRGDKGHRRHGGSGPDIKPDITPEPRGVVYEHIRVTPGLLEECGEHIMTEGGPLHLVTDFFGADEAITNYTPGKDRWIATLINCADGRTTAWEKREQVIKTIREHFHIA